MDNYNKTCNEFSYEMPLHCFKSSFARSMLTDYNKQSTSRSFDSIYLDRPLIFEEPSNSDSLSSHDYGKSYVNEPKGVKQCITIPNNSFELPQEETIQSNRVKQDKNVAKLWKLKQSVTQTSESQAVGVLQDLANTESDVLRLHKECQRLMEENRFLQSMMSRHTSGMQQFVDTTLLQSQVDTLVWQLKQAELRQHMYQEVMEQVVKFLERAYRKLDGPKSQIESSNSPSRVSPWPVSALHIPHIMQIKESHNYNTFKDFTWRRPRKEQAHVTDTPTDKLSQEAFRLLRIAQSVLNTQEPNLTQRLYNNSYKQRSSTPNASSQRSSTAYTKGFDQPPAEPPPESSTSLDSDLNCSVLQNSQGILHISSLSSTHLGKYKITALNTSSSNSTSPSGQSLTQYSSSSCSIIKQQLSEDESGFSSMSSFQEVGLPLVDPGCYEEMELPSSTLDLHSISNPIDSVPSYSQQNNSIVLPRETLHVLWV